MCLKEVLGSPRVRNISAKQVISNIIDFGMRIDQALGSPRIDCGSTPAQRKTIICNSEIAPETIAVLEDMGHPTDIASPSLTAPGGSPLTFAAPGGLQFDTSQSVFRGGNNPFVPCTVVGATA